MLETTLAVLKLSSVVGLTIIKVSTHRKFKNKKQVPKEALKQKIFHEHFCSDDHNGIQDWVIALIEQVDDEKFLRQRELFWAHKLDTFYPNGLNQREIYAAY